MRSNRWRKLHLDSASAQRNCLTPCAVETVKDDQKVRTTMRLFASAALCCFLVICSLVAPSRACTSFCFDTPDGPVYSTNLDLITGEGHVFVNRRGIAKEGYRASTTGETAKWVAKFGSVTFNLVGRELPWSSMNEASLVMSSMQLNASKCPDPDERPPLSEAYLVQYVLDNCANVQEAIQAASVVRLSQYECASHYLVADETGDCAAFEFLDGQFVYYNGETFPVKRLSLRSFDLSSEAPLLMLDVNAKLEGIVGRSFQPYDHNVNLEIFRTFCDKWGIEVSEEGAVELIRFFESFECAP